MLVHTSLEIVGLANVFLSPLQVKRIHYRLIGVTLARGRRCVVVFTLAHGAAAEVKAVVADGGGNARPRVWS